MVGDSHKSLQHLIGERRHLFIRQRFEHDAFPLHGEARLSEVMTRVSDEADRSENTSQTTS